MSKVFLIIGKSFSGKDTLKNELLCLCKDRLHSLVRYTTRKKREDEIEGKDYYFITKEDLNRFDGKDVSITEFDSEYGTLEYITDFSLMEPDKNYVLIGDPKNVDDYKNRFKDDLCIIYLIPPHSEIFSRFSFRKENNTLSDKKYKEIYRRFIDDLHVFYKQSNYFMSNCNGIVITGHRFNMDKIIKNINIFIDSDISETLIIINCDKKIPILALDNHYTPNEIEIDYYNMAFTIPLINSKLVINTEYGDYVYSK